MDATPNLSLPYIMAAQSQKHVTHNEAIRALDAIVQLAVLDRDLTAPPGSPADGARYIVGPSPTGAWSGHAGNIAAYQDGAWMFYAPVEGWIAWIGDEDVAVVWDGSAWSALTTGGGGGGGGSGSYTTLGVNATADTTNRLTLAADATLLNHDGDGHQLKINKASAADTASVLYQDAFSGRAELGLAGDDDFHFKVSPDGTTWKEAILINRSTGAVTFPFTSLSGGREALTANRTYYVRTNGSDANTGLANSSGGAWLTLQHAYDYVASHLDLGGYTVTIQGGNTPSFTAGLSVAQPWTGGGAIILDLGGGSLNVTGSAVQNLTVLPGTLTVQNGTLIATGSGVINQGVGNIAIGSGVTFGACGFVHLVAYATGAIVNVTANTTVSGGGAAHWYAANGGLISDASHTITLTGTPAFSPYGFAFSRAGNIQCFSNTFSGSATGPRYLSDLTGVVFTNSGGASYLPGNSSGSTATGGIYA